MEAALGHPRGERLQDLGAVLDVCGKVPLLVLKLTRHRESTAGCRVRAARLHLHLLPTADRVHPDRPAHRHADDSDGLLVRYGPQYAPWVNVDAALIGCFASRRTRWVRWPVNALFYQFEDNDISIDSLARRLVIGLMSSLIVFVPTTAIAMLFRRIRPRVPPAAFAGAENGESDATDASKARDRRPSLLELAAPLMEAAAAPPSGHTGSVSGTASVDPASPDDEKTEGDQGAIELSVIRPPRSATPDSTPARSSTPDSTPARSSTPDSTADEKKANDNAAAIVHQPQGADEHGGGQDGKDEPFGGADSQERLKRAESVENTSDFYMAAADKKPTTNTIVLNDYGTVDGKLAARAATALNNISPAVEVASAVGPS